VFRPKDFSFARRHRSKRFEYMAAGKAIVASNRPAIRES
jgi:hypothetical protein